MSTDLESPPLPAHVRRLSNSDANLRDHAEVGSSSIKYIAGCPGWTRDKRPKPPHPVTESGTRCHIALETGDYSGLQDEIEVNLVKMAEEHLRSIGYDRWHKRIIEERVYVLGEENFGYFDLLGILDALSRFAHLVDYKFGWNPVDDAADNWQAWFLVVGIFDRWTSLKTIWVDFPMPRVGKVTRAKFTRKDDYDRLKTALFAVTERRRQYRETQDATMLRPSFEHCQYCGAKATCPVLIHLADNLAARKEQTPLVVPDIVRADEVNDGDTLGQLRDLSEILADWADATKFHATQKRLDEGIEVKGWKVVEKSNARSITDNVSTYRIAREEGITPEEFALCSEIKVGKLEDFIGSKAPRGEKKKRIAAFLEKLIEADAIKIPEKTSYLKRE
jgi:hypothetical protein